MSRMKRVIYLSSTRNGELLLEFLRTQACKIIVANTINERLTHFPEYDLGISFLYTYKIPASEFREPYKWVNFHPGPLPEFRGRNLAYHAIMQKSASFGATIHYMDAEFDTGEIIEVQRFPIEETDTAGDLVRKSHNLLVKLFMKHIPLLLRGKLPSYPQGPGTYYQKVEIVGHIQLNDEQQRLIRAVTVAPRYYATTTIGGKLYRIVALQESNSYE